MIAAIKPHSKSLLEPIHHICRELPVRVVTEFMLPYPTNQRGGDFQESRRQVTGAGRYTGLQPLTADVCRDNMGSL